MAFLERWTKIPRKVHITRILGTNKNGDIIPDIWADVERWDKFTRHTQDVSKTLKTGFIAHFQKLLAKFDWRDDPDNPSRYRAEDDTSEDEDGTARGTVVVKVCSPDEEDLDDPEEWIPVRVMKRIRMKESGNDKGMMSVKKFLTKLLTTNRENRKVEFRRIVHYDTSIDEEAEKAFRDDPTRKAYVARAHNYAKDDETKDEDNYIEVEVVKEIMKRDNLHGKSNGSEQKTFVKFKNQYLIDESEKAELKEDERGENDINPPYRLDPFQNIININFGSLAVEFEPKDKDNPTAEVDPSYVTLPNVEDFSKALFSFWFRVPKESLEETYDEWERPPQTNVPFNPDRVVSPLAEHILFNGITPLWMFGNDTVKGHKIYYDQIPTDTYALETWTQLGVTNYAVSILSGQELSQTVSYGVDRHTKGDDVLFEPCFVGIDSNRQQIESYDPEDGGDPPTPNVLLIRFQMTTKAKASGVALSKTAASFTDSIENGNTFEYGSPRSGGAMASWTDPVSGVTMSYIGGNGWQTVTEGYSDITKLYLEGKTEQFEIKLDGKEVTPDRWHHVTFSVDFSGKISATGVLVAQGSDPDTWPDHGTLSSTCRAYIAYDDVPYKGANMRNKLDYGEYVTSRFTLDQNGMYTLNGINAGLTRFTKNGVFTSGTDGGPIRTTAISGVSLPTYNYEPKKIDTKDFFLGIPATAKYKDYIRTVEMAEFQGFLHIAKDVGEEKIRRLFIDKDGKPVPPKEAAKVLGEQHILLHRSGNWINGTNTGRDGENNPFTPEGRIIKYRPDPSLHGPQKPGEK